MVAATAACLLEGRCGINAKKLNSPNTPRVSASINMFAAADAVPDKLSADHAFQMSGEGPS